MTTYQPVDKDTMRFLPDSIEFFDRNTKYEFNINTEGQLSVKDKALENSTYVWGQVFSAPQTPKITCFPRMISFKIAGGLFRFTPTGVADAYSRHPEYPYADIHVFVEEKRRLVLVLEKKDAMPIVAVQFCESEWEMFARFLFLHKDIPYESFNADNWEKKEFRDLDIHKTFLRLRF